MNNNNSDNFHFNGEIDSDATLSGADYARRITKTCAGPVARDADMKNRSTRKPLKETIAQKKAPAKKTNNTKKKASTKKPAAKKRKSNDASPLSMGVSENDATSSEKENPDNSLAIISTEVMESSFIGDTSPQEESNWSSTSGWTPINNPCHRPSQFEPESPVTPSTPKEAPGYKLPEKLKLGHGVMWAAFVDPLRRADANINMTAGRKAKAQERAKENGQGKKTRTTKSGTLKRTEAKKVDELGDLDDWLQVVSDEKR